MCHRKGSCRQWVYAIDLNQSAARLEPIIEWVALSSVGVLPLRVSALGGTACAPKLCTVNMASLQQLP
jgi:hypothetical protein